MESVGYGARTESGYSLERVQKFLSSTKGKRNVVTEFFPDRELSSDSDKFLMKQRGEGCLSSQDIHHLKKMQKKKRCKSCRENNCVMMESKWNS